MRAKKVHVKDIIGIKTNSYLVFELPSYLACISAKNVVSYVRRAYPRNDGCVYYTSISNNIIVIGATNNSTKRKAK